MSGEYEKIKNMTPEELREYRRMIIQEYRETVEHIDDPELVRVLDKAALILSENPDEPEDK